MNITSFVLLATLSIPIQDGKHSYDVALDHCRDKGGIAQYTDAESEVRFSCADDISRVFTIMK